MGLEVLGPYLAHVHLKNARWAPAGARDDGTVRWAAAFAPLDEGSVDVRDLLRALRAVGYDGWISFEDFSTDRPLLERTRTNLEAVRALLAATVADGDSRARPESSARTALDRLPRGRLAFLNHMTSRSRGARVLVMLVMLLGSVLASAAGADTTDDLTRARERMVAAQAAADAAAARYEAALAGHAQLEDRARPDPAAHRRDRSRREGVDEAGAGDRGACVRDRRGAGGRRTVLRRRCARSRSQHPAARSCERAERRHDRSSRGGEGGSRPGPRARRRGREGVGATARVPPIGEQPRAAGAHRGREREGADRTAHRAGEAAGDPGRRARNRGARGRGRDHHHDAPGAIDDHHHETEHADDQADARRRRSPRRRRRSRTNRRRLRHRRGTGSARCTVR